MKILISSCVTGGNVRWNGANKKRHDILEWALENDIELIPICPEDELFGTPRQPIRLVQIEDKICAQMNRRDVAMDLKKKCKEILDRYPDAIGFIGIAKSPTCGMSVGVKNLGGFVKGAMHHVSFFPTTECNHMNNDYNKNTFLNRVKRYLQNA